MANLVLVDFKELEEVTQAVQVNAKKAMDHAGKPSFL